VRKGCRRTCRYSGPRPLNLLFGGKRGGLTRSIAWEFDMAIHSFQIDISTAVLEDLRSRLGITRWPEGLRDPGWTDGTSEVYLRALLQHWQHRFDWRAQEQAINRFAQFRAEIQGVGIHFIHERGRGGRPLPLILTHGYPDSFLRFRKLIPLLTDPT